MMMCTQTDQPIADHFQGFCEIISSSSAVIILAGKAFQSVEIVRFYLKK